MHTNRRETIALLGAAALAAPAAAQAQGQGKPRSRDKSIMWVASPTPCDKNLKVDLGAMAAQMQWFAHRGADGITVLGSGGEYPSFSMAERKSIMEVVGKNKGGMNIMCTTGTSNFPETIELSRHAADHGADCTLVVPPFYYKNVSDDGLRRYFSLVLEATPKLDVHLYHVPGYSAVPLSDGLIASLKHYPNLAGVKDSGDDMAGYIDRVKNFPDLNISSGTFAKLEYGMLHGMSGVLSEGVLLCRPIADMFVASRAGKDIHPQFAKITAQMDVLFKLCPRMEAYGPMKYALSQLMGTPQTYPRPPATDVTEDEKAAIRKGLAQIKVM
jgi:4-hydroxy-tetrahydrodipicolinate synthase